MDTIYPCGRLAFANQKLEKYKTLIATWRPIALFALALPCAVLLQQNTMHVLFSLANPLFWSLSAIYLHQVLFWSIPFWTDIVEDGQNRGYQPGKSIIRRGVY